MSAWKVNALAEPSVSLTALRRRIAFGERWVVCAGAGDTGSAADRAPSIAVIDKIKHKESERDRANSRVRRNRSSITQPHFYGQVERLEFWQSIERSQSLRLKRV